ncbi:MAG: hypothetical protein OWQ57_03190 [Sulfobacillus sp.]|nr:hypothetical protein [Sulfobacillus sp.]
MLPRDENEKAEILKSLRRKLPEPMPLVHQMVIDKHWPTLKKRVERSDGSSRK